MATQQQDNIVVTESSASSGSGSGSNNYTYHAFLSFRGADVRYDFADWLYNELVSSGLYTFRDDDDIKRGLDLGLEIAKAIRESKVAVIIFSKDFASSSYCLDELAMFMERREVQVLPVFFKVDPDNLANVYAPSFEKHEEKLESLQGVELEALKIKLKRWKEAIQKVALITGRHAYEIGYQSEFIREVVDDARRLANLVILDIPSHVVGKPHRFIHLHGWVKNESHDKRIALLHGPYGIGKKTIVAVVSNKNYRHFDATAFFDKVGENSRASDGIVKLQLQLLSRLRNLKGKSDITSELEGIAAIKAALKNKRVLIVLADLDQADLFFKLIPGPEYLERGSKVIVTSVNKNLLGDNFCVKFPVEPLLPILSLELFSWHAFGTPRPMEGRERHVMAALRYCCGIPLALEKFAALSSSLGMDHWDGLLPDITEDPKLMNDLEARIATLKMVDKKLFFDIACFYAGMDFDHVDSVLKSRHLYKEEGGFDRLRSKHLVSVDSDNKVTMDQRTIEMAREILCRQTVCVEELSNICSPEDAIELFRECSGTKHIRSFILDGEDVPVSSASEMEFKTKAFTGMTKLKLLKLVDIQLKGNINDLPKGLVWLSFVGTSLPLIPDDNYLEHLVVLELHNSTIKLWNKWRSLKNLKILNLSRSPMLVKTPDFTRLSVPKLERLILEDCTGLVEIDSSIEVLENLVVLSLQRCRSLKKLPALGSLVRLDISGCPTLHAMPNKRIESVKELSAKGTAMDGLVAESPGYSFSEIFLSLVKLNLRINRLWAESTAYSFSEVFPCLVKLNLCKCNLSDVEVIDDLVKLPSLEDLDLSQNLFTAMPEALGTFLSLRSLSLSHCEHLEVVRKLPNGLKKLNVWHCTSLRKIEGIVRPEMVLCAVGCANLVQIGEATRFEAARGEDIEMMRDLKFYDWNFSDASYEIEVANTCTGMIKKTLVQEQELVFHCGTLNLFARGSEVPEGYEHEEEKTKMFRIQPAEGRRVIGINLCILYRTRGKYTSNPILLIICARFGDSNQLMWMHIPVTYGIANEEEEEDMMWLSHWKLAGQIEAGDILGIQVEAASDAVEVRSYGIRLATEDQAEQKMSKCSWYQKLDVDWSTYEQPPGVFNIGNASHRGVANNDYHYGGHFFGNLPQSEFKMLEHFPSGLGRIKMSM